MLTHKSSLVLLYVIIAMATNAHKEPPRQTISPSDNSTIQSIEEQAKLIEKSTRRWNQAYMWLGFVALVIGVASASSLYFANKESQRLAARGNSPENR